MADDDATKKHGYWDWPDVEKEKVRYGYAVRETSIDITLPTIVPELPSRSELEGIVISYEPEQS